ncbi:MAG: LLM class flavin-dependent oxidoreductase [Candidatus Caldarchaeum sp.]
MSLKFDLTVGPFLECPKNAVELSIYSEKLGFNGVWVTHDPLWENSWVIAGGIAANTSKIQVGPGIVNPFSSTKVEIAMGAATLQNLSNGRAVLGFGPGSRKMLEESGLRHVNLLQTLDESVTYLKEVLNPATSPLKSKPVKPVEIYIGCQSPTMLRRIGKWRVGGLMLLTPPSFGEDALRYVKEGYSGQIPSDFPGNQIASILCSIDTDENNARKSFAKFIIHILRYLAEVQLRKISLDYDDVVLLEQIYREEGWEALPEKIYSLGAVGVEGLIKTVENLHSLGFTRFKIGSPLGPEPRNAVKLIAEKVLSYFRN